MSIRWPRFLTPSRFSQIIKHQKNPLKALQIFNHVKTRFPDYRHTGSAYATMIDILGSSRRLKEMGDVIQQMKEDYCPCKDSFFAKTIRLYFDAGLLHEALRLFEQIPEFNCVSWTHTFNILLEIMMENGHLEAAYRLYLENSNRWEVKTRVESFNLLIAALCKINRSDLAIGIFEEMNVQSCYPDRETYRILMKGLCREGKLKTATHLLYSMFWRISQKGSGADIVVYRILLEALCDHEEIEEVSNILNKVLKKGLKSPKRHFRSLDIAANFATGKTLEDIKGLISNVLVKGGVPSFASYTAMIDDFYFQGKIEKGSGLLDEMCLKGFRPLVSTYEAKIMALCKGRRADEAAKVLEVEMVQGSCVPTAKTFKLVIEGLCKQGKSTRAVVYLEKMAKQVGCVVDKDTHVILVEGLCNEGMFVEASAVLDRMLDWKYWPSDDTFNSVIRGLCGVGRMYESVLWLEEMVSQGKTPPALVWNSLVASACCDAEMADKHCRNISQLMVDE